MCCDGNPAFRDNLVTGSTELPGVIRRWCSMQAKGGRGGRRVSVRGPVWGNSVASSLIQN